MGQVWGQAYDADTDIIYVLDYAKKSDSVANVRDDILDLNNRINDYLKEVERVIEAENAYALNANYFSVCGVDVTQEPVQTIYDSKVALVADWKKCKNKIKRKVLERRIEILSDIYTQCSHKLSLAAGWGIKNESDKKYDSKRKKVWEEKTKTQKRLDNMK